MSNGVMISFESLIESKKKIRLMEFFGLIQKINLFFG